MLPSDDLLTIPVVVEGLVTRFKYWNETVQEGIQYQGDLYTCVKTYSVAERLQTFAEGQEYIAAGSKVCITRFQGKIHPLGRIAIAPQPLARDGGMH
ncbi:MAG: hypothetical protein HC812_17195 [Leptolyngbya sp. RL_3_1]|nr:hypothetical protein [Leptolyngbya sp. RL_3_1]